AEDERDHHVLEPHAHPVAGERWGAEGADQPGEEHDREIRLDRVDDAGSADSQDFAKERPAETDAGESERRQAPPRQEVREEDARAERVEGEERGGRARDAETRERTPAAAQNRG